MRGTCCRLSSYDLPMSIWFSRPSSRKMNESYGLDTSRAPEHFLIEWSLSFYVECADMARLPRKPSGNPGAPKRPSGARNCQPFSQIVVSAFAPGTQPETVKCTSSRPFLVYCSTNFSPAPPPGWGYSVNVKSTGSGGGSLAPTYIVGGPANDVITFILSQGVTGFLTLQTECGAKGSISG